MKQIFSKSTFYSTLANEHFKLNRILPKNLRPQIAVANWLVVGWISLVNPLYEWSWFIKEIGWEIILTRDYLNLVTEDKINPKAIYLSKFDFWRPISFFKLTLSSLPPNFYSFCSNSCNFFIKHCINLSLLFLWSLYLQYHISHTHIKLLTTQTATLYIS